MTHKANWEEIRKLVEEQIGPVVSVEHVSEGRNSEVSVIVRNRSGDIAFVKGRRADHKRAWTQERERIINPTVVSVSPRVMWRARSDAWDLTGFEYIPGKHADYSPGSPDLPKIVATMRRLQQIPCPALDLKRAEQRWASYTNTPRLLAGASLLHTEWSPGNVLVSERAYLVDWAWPTIGAAWIDSACWVVWLIAAGHSPGAAERQAAEIPAWGDAPTGALDEFARIQALMWEEIALESLEPWAQSVAAASLQWASYRAIPPRSLATGNWRLAPPARTGTSSQASIVQ